MSDVPLSRHALLSDCRSAAFITAAGSVHWLCLPRFDSAPVFARLHDEDAGHFWSPRRSLAGRRPGPTGPRPSSWTPSGRHRTVSWWVTDAVAMGTGESRQELGLNSPGVLLRRASCTLGTVTVRVEYAPRPEFGLMHPRLSYDHPQPGESRGAVVADGGATMLLLLRTPADLQLSPAEPLGC